MGIKRILMAVGSLGLIFSFNSSNALAANCTHTIDNLPYWATEAGTHCLASDHTFITTWNSSVGGITVSADDVTVDLQGHTISGRWANGPAPYGPELGIVVTNNANRVTVKNGVLKGLGSGIVMGTNTGSNAITDLVVENMTIDSMIYNGVAIGMNSDCNNCTIRNNLITNTDASLCTTCGGWTGSYAIYFKNYSNNIVIENNTISGVASRGPLPSYGIYLMYGSNALVKCNTIIDVAGSETENTAILALSFQNMDAENNSLLNFYRGIRYSGSTGTYSGTRHSNVTIPYTGGTDGGNNQ